MMADTHKGIGMPYVFPEDLTRTRSDWYYNWTPTIAPNCVPMSWGGDDPHLPLDYSGYVLLFNEPDRPDQADLPPAIALVRYKELVQMYPRVKWVVGNTFYPNWLYTFHALCLADPDCVMPEYWGIHAYLSHIEYLPMVRSELIRVHNKLGGTFWITEFSATSGDISLDEGFVRFFKSQDWIARYAYFCNRAKGDEAWYPSNWNVQLFDWDTGEPTRIGKWYSDGLHNAYMPVVRRG